MARVELTRAARADLVEIAAFTIERWGDAQADRYLAAIYVRLRWLRKNARSGTPCRELLPGYLQIAEGRHVIFYRFVGDSVEVVRVLHQRMLPRLHILG